VFAGGRKLTAFALLLFLAACGPIIPSTSGPTAGHRPPPRRPPVQQSQANALMTGVRAGPVVASLSFTRDDAAGALASFRASCPRLLTRTDGSGLTRAMDWKPACDAAAAWPAAEAPGFFARFFETARVDDGSAFVTGYYEPEIAGVRLHQPGFDVPVYGLPADLVRARVGDAPPLPDGRQPLGRYDATGRFAPYYTRADIEDGVLMGKGLEIAWAADPADFYFMQVQGSGRLRAPDGSVMSLGYAGQNGASSTLIGGLMRQRGLIGNGPGQYPGSMQGILRYLREHPVEGREMLRANQAYVFFREAPGTDDRGGPAGALGVPVRARSSVAVDPVFVPLGAPVWLSLDRSDANGLWIAQDVGGAIKGANRFDTFWGAGSDARATAGGMSAHGQALLLLPRGTLQRLGLR
jgi:membrane-bound lytic murein transglycosylase A